MQNSTVSTELFLEGGGLMGSLIREKDWTQTPLGHPSQWPQSLKTCVRIILTSQQPMFVWWGKALINIYNDACLSIIGGKHPVALGQPASEVWMEIWDEVGKSAYKVMTENVGTYDEALLLLMERNGYTEETYYTFSYSPVPGDDGTTQGIICTHTDETQKIVDARQLLTLKELSKNIANIKSNQEICNRALDVFKDNPKDFPFVALYEVSDNGEELNLARKLPDDWSNQTVDLAARKTGWHELDRAIQTGEIVAVNDIKARFGTLPSGVWNDSPDKMLLIPILQGNRQFPFAIMAVGTNPYRLLDDKLTSFYALAAGQISTALTRACAFRQQRKRAGSQVVEQEGHLPNSFTKEAKMMAAGKKTETPPNRTNKPLVLVVEDNSDMQSYISKLLEKDYHTIVASNGKQALDCVAASMPNLIISDIVLPEMDGIELLQVLKKDPIKRRIPVLLLSARTSEATKIEDYDFGADDYLVKPFSAKELLARVQSQLRISMARSHLDTQLRNLFMQAPLSVCIFRGSEFIVEMANPRMLELWGKQAAEVINKPFFTGMPDIREQGYEALLEKVFTTGETFSAKEQSLELIRNGKPEKIFVKFVFEPLRDEDGSISGIMALADEITEQVETRKKIEVSETRNKLALEAAEMGNFEWDITRSGFVYSDRLAQIFGYENSAGLDHSAFSDRIHPDDRQIRLDAHRKAFEAGILFYEARVIWPDLSVHWVRLNGKVVFDDNGEASKMYGTVLDISKHKIHSQTLEEKVRERTRNLIAKNQQLKESEERFQRMTDEVQDYVIILLDRDGNILNWNKGAEKIKGYKESEIVGKNFRVFYTKGDLENKIPDNLIEEARSTGRAMSEGFRVRKDGTLFWGSVSITALHDNQNNVIGFSKVTRDLTERKLAEDRMQKYNAELEFQNKELEQFAYVASHDLQEPLRKIQMFSGLLEKSIHNKETVDKYFAKINSTAERMSELIKAVLNYSRLSRGDQQFEAVDLNAVLTNVLVDFELLIEEKGAVVHYDNLPVIKAIPLQINQLFSNLIGNSLKFSETMPKITIASRVLSLAEIPFESNLSAERYLELIFSDRGIGFEQKYLSKIFTIFQRLNDRMSYSGTGIGLALCKKIIENHSGYITAKSEQGKGASFFIYLPCDNF